MTRVNVSVPDEVHDAAREAGLNVSQITTAALQAELDRRDKAARLRAELSALDAELGTVGQADMAAARAWVADLLAGEPPTGERTGVA